MCDTIRIDDDFTFDVYDEDYQEENGPPPIAIEDSEPPQIQEKEIETIILDDE